MCSQPKPIFFHYVSAQKWTEYNEVDQNGPKWLEYDQMNQIGPNMTEVGRSELNRNKVYQIGSKWTK